MIEYYAPLGDQSVANSTTSGAQTAPRAAALALGGYVVVWEDASGSADDPSVAIRGQRFDSAGAKTGAEFLVNTVTAGDQTDPSVAWLSTGGFVVTWTGTDPSGSGIKGQLYTADGGKSGGEFQVNTSASGQQDGARAIFSPGGFGVVWLDHDAGGTAIRGQLFSNGGVKLGSDYGGEFLVASAVPQARGDLSVAWVNDGSNDGRLVVTWTEAGGDGSGTAVMAQVINYYGVPFGAPFPVGQTALGDQLDASVATYHHAHSDGFIVAYVDSADAGGAGAVTVRIFDAKGRPVSADLRLTQPGSGARDPSVVSFESGLFAVSWRGPDGSVQVQMLNAAGELLGTPLEAGSAGEEASLIRLGTESFVALWADGDVQTRTFAPAGPAVADLALSDTQTSEAVPSNLTVAEVGATGIGGSSGFSYALLSDSSGGAFVLEGNRLVLADPTRIDFETAPQVELSVRVTDSGGRTRDEIFTLDVADAAVEAQGWTASDRFEVKNTPYGAIAASLAPLADGGFVMVYYDLSSAGSPVRGQIFSSNGEKVGGELVLPNSSSTGQSPLVASLSDGGFAVLFSAPGDPQSALQYLFTQRFDGDGQTVGDRVRVGTGQGGQTGAIVALPDGGFVVSYSNAWHTVPWGQTNLFAQRFDSDGDMSGAAVPVASGSEAGPSTRSTVASLADGGFIVVWMEGGVDAIFAQRFDAEGVRVGTTFQVDAPDSRHAVDPDVTGLAGGGFVISWTDGERYQPGQIDPWSVKAQIFDAAGAKVGGEFVVNSDAVAEQRISTVTPLLDGGFMVVWNEHATRLDYGESDWSGGVPRAQRFDSSGNRIGGEFALDEGFTQQQGLTAAATLSWGGVVVTYSDNEWLTTGARVRLLSPGTFDARDDSIVGFETSGASGSLFADNGSGADSVPADGATLIAEVNGSSANVGETIVLASGALLTVNSDGTFDYDPDGAFDHLAAFGTGGSNSVGFDSFTYRLAGGDTATVSLAIRGEYSAPHVIQGSSGADTLTGTSGSESFMLQLGGQDSVEGGAGNDSLFFIGSLTGADAVNGGDGTDTLVLQGPYGSLTLTSNVTGIENISILGGNNTNFGEPGTNRYDYVLTTADSNFAAGVQARINGSALLADEDFTFDGSAETNAHFVVYGGKGKDTLTGGLGNDIFFFAEERFGSGDVVNGGAGYNGMFLRGNYTIDFNAPGYTGLFTNIQNLTLTSATDERYARGGGTEFDYDLTLSDAIVNAGHTLTASGSLLQANETMILDGSQETDGLLRLFGGKADDTLKGGGKADLIHGNLGADQLTGNGGADTFRYDSTADSNGSSLDHITDFTPGTDKIDLSRIDANTAAAGDQAFAWIGSNAFSGTAGELRVVNLDNMGWFLQGDTDGNGGADFVVMLTLQGQTPLSASDFIL